VKHLAILALLFVAVFAVSAHADTSNCDSTNFNSTGHFGCWITVSSPTSQTLVAAGGIGLENQLCWVYLNNTNMPEGGYHGIMALPGAGGSACVGGTANLLPAVITLPATLVAGHYHVFAYAFKSTNNEDETVDVTMGGATSSPTVTLTTSNTTWTGQMDITTVSSAATITVNFRQVATTVGNVFLHALYITDNLNVTVLQDGTAVDLTYPTARDDTSAVPGNLIQDSSFEACIAASGGLDANWGINPVKRYSSASLCDNSDGHTGTTELKLPLDAGQCVWPLATCATNLESRTYHLKANKAYALSAWVKASTGTVAGSIYAVNTFTPPAGYHAQWYAGNAFTATTSWTRACLDVTHNTTYPDSHFIAYPTSDFYIQFQIPSNYSGAYLFIDDIQLEEGTACTTYGAGFPLEVDIQTENDGHIYFSNGTLTANRTSYNPTGSQVTKTLNWAIYDYLNNQIGSTGSASITVAATTVASSTISIATGSKLGPFRMVYWISGVNGSQKEFVYSIIPPSNSGADLTSYMGLHPNYITPLDKTYQRMGLKWARTLHGTPFCRWNQAEAVEGTFVYDDPDVDEANTYNINTLCTLGNGGNDVPSYAGNPPNTTKLQTFCSTLTTHYKDHGVLYYEIFNEPLSAYTADQYSDILVTCTDAVKAADASAKVVCMGGLASQGTHSVQEVLDALTARHPTWNPYTHCDAFSSHDYPGGVNPFALTQYVNLGMPVWNTEAAGYSLGPYVASYSNWISWGIPVLPFQSAYRFYEEYLQVPSAIAYNFGQTIAAGQTNYEYYDGTLAPEPINFVHSPSLREYDGSVRVKGISYVMAGTFIDHSTGYGSNVAFAPNTSQFWIYDTGGTSPVAGLVSADGQPRQVSLVGVSHGDFNCYDQHRNQITISGVVVPYGSQMVWCIGNGISTTTLRTALSGNTISTRIDTTPPSVTIDDYPIVASTTGSTRLRWHAGDDVYSPNLGLFNNGETLANQVPPNPDAILYSYQVVGEDSDWSSWAEGTYIDRTLTMAANYFNVRAKDAAGNISNTVCVDLLSTCTNPGVTLTAVSPSSSIQGLVVPVTLTGTAFDGGNAVVSVDGTGVTVSSTVVVSATTITATFTVAVNASLGAHNVTVTTDAGTSGTQGFTVNAPSLVTGQGRGQRSRLTWRRNGFDDL
jgi:hypothetical protein